jgi:hypothetical protein
VTAAESTQKPAADKPAVSVQQGDGVFDLRPDTRLKEKIHAERAQDSQSNLLDNAQPVE